MERKQKLRIGVTKESEEALFRDILVLDDVISEMDKEQREAGKALSRVAVEWRRIEANERRETDAAGGGVTWTAASGAQSSRSLWRDWGWRQPEGLAGRSKLHEQCWRFAEEEERSGTERTCCDAGLQFLPAE